MDARAELRLGDPRGNRPLNSEAHNERGEGGGRSVKYGVPFLSKGIWKKR